MDFNTKWFKDNLEQRFSKYELEYRFFENGDLGALDEVGFENEQIGGGINYWGQGYLGIFVYDYTKGDELMNILIDPDKTDEKIKAINEMLKLLNISR